MAPHPQVTGRNEQLHPARLGLQNLFESLLLFGSQNLQSLFADLGFDLLNLLFKSVNFFVVLTLQSIHRLFLLIGQTELAPVLGELALEFPLDCWFLLGVLFFRIFFLRPFILPDDSTGHHEQGNTNHECCLTNE